MSDPKHAERLKAIEAKRPKKYETFTSNKGESRSPFQKTRYAQEGTRGARVMVDEQVSITVQKGLEFDVWRECIGSKDGKIPPSPILFRMVTEGYMRDGKKVLLEPADLQEFLERKRRESTNKILYWKDRARPEAEKYLEKLLEEKTQIIDASKVQTEALRRMLKGRGVKDEEIEAAIKGG